MNTDLTSQLEIMGYLVVGTVTIAVVIGWVVKRFGPRE